MKKLIATLVLVMMSTLAMALPTPKDIESAVSAGQLTRAEEMLKDVIRDKPGSAKAHYELGQVLERAGRKIEARDELETAKRLDPTLRFARDPQHFNDILNRVSGSGNTSGAGPTLQSSRADVAAVPTPAPVTPASPSIPWGYVLLGTGGLLAAWMFMRRRSVASGGGAMMAGAGVGAVPAAAGYGPGYGGGVGGAQPAAGAGIGGAVLGGVAGLAAGYGLAKVFEHSGDNIRGSTANQSGVTPMAPAEQPDYGNFDSGAGDSWDSADAGGTGSDDDNW